MELQNARLVLFFKEKFTGKYTDLASQLQDLFENIPPTILPLPQTAPDEIPRLIFNFTDFNIEISNIRIEISLKGSKIHNVKKINTERLPSIIDKIFQCKIINEKISFIRLGYITNYFIEKSHSDLKSLLNPKLNQDYSFEEIEIKINKFEEINNLKCNNIEHLLQGEKKEKENKIEGLLLISDLNTSQHNKESISTTKIKSLVEEFIKKSSESKLLKCLND